jgi:hypothetical protein
VTRTLGLGVLTAALLGTSCNNATDTAYITGLGASILRFERDRRLTDRAGQSDGLFCRHVPQRKAGPRARPVRPVCAPLVVEPVPKQRAPRESIQRLDKSGLLVDRFEESSLTRRSPVSEKRFTKISN